MFRRKLDVSSCPRQCLAYVAIIFFRHVPSALLALSQRLIQVVGLIFRRTHFERQVYVKVPVSGSVLFLDLHIVYWDTSATSADKIEWGSEIILEPNKSDNAMLLAAIHRESILRCVH
jgi:hypothetical protein